MERDKCPNTGDKPDVKTGGHGQALLSQSGGGSGLVWIPEVADGSSGLKQAGEGSNSPDQLLQSLVWTNRQESFQKHRQAFTGI